LPKTLCLMGPTASGKTALAMALCDKHNGEIISVDSAMVYKGLDIGSAKPDQATLEKYPHHLVDIRDVAAPYSAADFIDDAQLAIKTIHEKNKTPILVGGTMLYYKALQQGISDLPSANKSVREKLVKEAEQHGWQHLHDRLLKIDPKSAARIHVNDSQRLQRALEVYELSRKTLSQHFAQQAQKSEHNYINVALDVDKDILRERITERFMMMLDQGFIDEVKRFFGDPKVFFELPAMKSVGYQQAWQYLSGEYDKDTMIEKAITATCQLAKRQRTWLRSFDVEVKTPDKILAMPLV
jgi:tRNA dimethylallyltransferase